MLQRLSATALLFENGRLAMQGETRAVVEHYLAAQRGLMTTPLAERLDRTGRPPPFHRRLGRGREGATPAVGAVRPGREAGGRV